MTSWRSVSGCGPGRCGFSRSPGLVGSARHGSPWRPRARSRPTSPTARTSSRSPRCTDTRTCPRRSSRRSGSSCSPASRPTRPPSAFWPPSTCCWSPTTSSTCSQRRPSSADCLRPRHRSRFSPRVANRSLCRPRSATRCRRSRCPRPGHPRALARWPTRTPWRCSASARGPTTPTST